MSISVNIQKKIGSFFLNINFEGENETIALLGASGCGKSMTLKCIAGIEKPDKGRIVVDDIVLFDSEQGVNLSPQQRQVGIMFQNYALFPNMTVLQNIQAGAKRSKEKSQQREAVQRLIDRFELTDLTKRYPHQLSGGQQQRVALARMLVSEPRILLLDEPFSALDSHLRFRLERELRQVIRDFGKTVLLVSHDRDEVFRMSDQIAVMDRGKIEVFGPKHRVFCDPKSRSGAMLTGCKNISRLEKISPRRVRAVDWGMELNLEREVGQAAYLGIRMHDIKAGSGENSFRCRVVEEIENPFSFTIMLQPLDAEGTIPVGWEMEKESWRTLRAEEVAIFLPKESLLLLEERQYAEKS